MIGKTAEDRLYLTNRNNNGSIMKIIEYKSATNMKVEFDDGYKTRATWESFRRGNVRNPYDKTVCGIGYIGEGIHKVKNGRQTYRAYDTWNSMLKRCYSEAYQKRNKAYLHCLVVEEWHNYQNFADWYYENYYEVNGERMHLDKDILKKGNKVYAQDNCVFVPQTINSLFIKHSKGNLPMGVIKKKKFYEAYHSDSLKGIRNNVYLGSSETPEGAFLLYKEHKENLIKKRAEQYKKVIPHKLYIAMINYEIEMIDKKGGKDCER